MNKRISERVVKGLSKIGDPIKIKDIESELYARWYHKEIEGVEAACQAIALLFKEVERLKIKLEERSP